MQMASATKISPPGPGAYPQPALHELDSEAFERFCLDLTCGHTKDIETADLYEPSGAKQYGADYYLDRGDAGLIIGSCKAHEKPGKNAILDEAVGEFVKYWESYWKPQNVVKFIICLAGDARSTTRKKHIDDAKRQIRALGIECEVWAKRELLSLCAPLPHVVRRSLGSQWLPYLCEILLPYANDQSLPLVESMALEIEALHSAQTPIINDKLDALQELLHAGDIDRAAAEADEIRNTAVYWLAAEPKQKAQILRTIALRYVPSDIDKAAALYDEAAIEHPHTDRYFSALVLLHREGRAAALAMIDDPRTARERSFKAALLVESGKSQDAIDLVGDIDEESNDLAELARIKSIGLMITARADEAIEAAEIAVKAKPGMRAARTVYAIACYAASLSPAARPPGLFWPEPLPSALVKTTKGARRMRHKALQLFEALDRDAPSQKMRKPLQVWRLACLIEEPDERETSVDLIEDALANNLFHPGLILWALSRKLGFDRTRARRALRKLIKHEDPEAVSALLAIHADERKFKAGRTLLAEHSETLKLIDADAPEMWDREFSARQGKLEKSKDTDTLIGFGSAPDDATLESILLDGDESSYRRFEAAMLLAEHDQWQPIRKAVAFLMEIVTTAEAFRLCAYAISNIDAPKEALNFLDEHCRTYFEDGLPWDLARIRIELMAASGDMAAALESAEQTLIDPSRPEFILRAELEAQAGDIRTAGRFIAQAVAAENVGLKSPDRKLHWANILKSEDQETAAALLSAARADGLKGLAGPAMGLAFELLPDEAPMFMAALNDETKNGADASVRVLSFDETLEMWQDNLRRQADIAAHYEAGDLFSHAVYNDRMGLAFLAPFESDGKRWRPDPHIAHAENSGPRDITFDKVVVDVTAILTAEALNLWPRLVSRTFDIILPAEWSAALLSMEHSAAVGQQDRFNARELVLKLVREKKIRTVNQRVASSKIIVSDGDTVTESGAIRGASIAAATRQSGESGSASSIFDGSILHIDVATSMDLALAGELSNICSRAVVTLEKWDHATLIHEHEQEEIGNRVAARLKKLRNWLAAEMRARRISVAPPHGAKSGRDDCPGSTTEAAFWSVLYYPPEEGLVAWIDDRYINGHNKINETPIIGVQTILAKLASDGAITEESNAEQFRILRQNRFVHLVPSVSEIAAALSSSIAETPDFEAIAPEMESAAARFSCQHKAVLEKQAGNGAIPEHQAAFGQFLVASRVVRTLIADVSVDDGRAAQICCAVCHLYRADWRDGVHGAELEEAAANLFVTWHASILTACLELPVLANEKGRKRDRHILDALYATITETATEASPTLLTDIHRRISVALTHGVANADSEDVEFIRALTGRYIDAMPSALREGLFQHEPLRRIFGVSASVTAGEKSFDEHEFWSAIERLSSGETDVHAESISGETSGVSLDPLGIVLSIPDGETVRILFPVPGIFSPESEKRISSISSFLEEAGFASRDRSHLVRQFKSASTARDRDNFVQSLLTETIPGKLWPLTRLEQGAQISIDDIAPPSASALNEWLGFDSHSENEAPDAAFENLSDQFDELEACKRWCGVPRRFPKRAIDWLAQMSVEDAKSAANALAQYASHPIAVRNVYDLLSLRKDLAAESSNLRDRLLDGDYADYGGQLLLARGAIQQIVQMHDGNSNPTVRLCGAWAWIDRLRVIMLSAGAQANAIAEWFAEVSKPGRGGLIDLARLNDVMNPMTVKTEQVVCGVFDGLSESEMAKLSANQKEILCAALSNDLTGTVPSVSLLATEMSDNSSESWLGGPRKWLATLFDVDNEFLRDALTDPVALRQRVLDHPLPEPIALAAVGVGGISDHDAIQFIRKVKFAIARADANELALFATLVGGLRLKNQAAIEQRRALFRKVARRKIALADAGEDDPKGAAMLVEAAVTAVINEESDWVKPVEAIVREFATIYSPRYARPVAGLLTLLGDCAPMRDRALLFRLRAEVIAAA